MSRPPADPFPDFTTLGARPSNERAPCTHSLEELRGICEVRRWARESFQPPGPPVPRLGSAGRVSEVRVRAFCDVFTRYGVLVVFRVFRKATPPSQSLGKTRVRAFPPRWQGLGLSARGNAHTLLKRIHDAHGGEEAPAPAPARRVRPRADCKRTFKAF